MPALTRTPPWADFPVAEYEHRLATAQAVMAGLEVDAVVLVCQENIEYFAGFQSSNWQARSFPMAALVLHRAAPPVLVVPAFLETTARACSWVEALVTDYQPHRDPREFGPAVASAVLGHGVPGTVAFESGTHLAPPWNLVDYEYLRTALRGSRIVPGGEIVWQARTIKSAFEIERLTFLSSLTHQAIRAAIAEFRPGMTERELSRAVLAGMVAGGADGMTYANLRGGAGRYRHSDSIPQDNPLVEGDMILVDTGARFRTYTCDVGRVAHVGRASSARHDVHRILLEAQAAVIVACEPGTSAARVHRAGHEVLARAGLPGIGMFGHGVGLDLHEPPVITAASQAVIREGMVLTAEAWLYGSRDPGVFCVKDMIAVGPDGPRRLTPEATLDELWEVGTP